MVERYCPFLLSQYRQLRLPVINGKSLLNCTKHKEDKSNQCQMDFFSGLPEKQTNMQ